MGNYKPVTGGDSYIPPEDCLFVCFTPPSVTSATILEVKTHYKIHNESLNTSLIYTYIIYNIKTLRKHPLIDTNGLTHTGALIAESIAHTDVRLGRTPFDSAISCSVIFRI